MILICGPFGKTYSFTTGQRSSLKTFWAKRDEVLPCSPNGGRGESWREGYGLEGGAVREILRERETERKKVGREQGREGDGPVRTWPFSLLGKHPWGSGPLAWDPEDPCLASVKGHGVSQVQGLSPLSRAWGSPARVPALMTEAPAGFGSPLPPPWPSWLNRVRGGLPPALPPHHPATQR